MKLCIVLVVSQKSTLFRKRQNVVITVIVMTVIKDFGLVFYAI